jgi:D-glycero-beta-D-manno-heptose 1-phosphate adenylyltransferase
MRWRRRQAHQHRRIVFTNGCFDVLHVGHIRYLERARALGECLIVGINTDASVRRIKGPMRPVQRARDRAEIIAALDCVDCVVLFQAATPQALITQLIPDVLVKGRDWAHKDIVGADIVQAAGGRVVRMPFVKGRSTTQLVQRIRRRG